jgi:hypothetical protein
MHFFKLLLFVFILSTLSAFSQESMQKETIVKKLEGVIVTYSEINGGADYVFNVNNTSGNTVELEWDVKVFFTESDSKELHKSVVVEPQNKTKIYTLRNLNEQKGQLAQAINTRKIKKIEVHNLKFKGLH